MLKKKNWTVALLQRPHGMHIAITDASQANWKDFVDSVRACT